MPGGPPWQLQEGSRARDVVVAQGSLATQRHILDMCANKRKGKCGKAKHKGKGTGTQPAQTATTAPASTPTPSTALPSGLVQEATHAVPNDDQGDDDRGDPRSA